MRYHTKEYYRLLMALGRADCYEPVIDKDTYTEEDIAELYQRAQDRYVEEERADYDAPPDPMIDDEDLEEFDPEDFTFYAPGLFDDADPDDLTPRRPADREELMKLCEKMYALAVEEYENRMPFDEEEAKADFEEMYRDNLREPDEDLPDWVREAVDPRIIAMEFLPEKIYMKLLAEDEANERSFDALDEAADEACEARMEELPPEYRDFTEVLEDLEDSIVISLGMEKGMFSSEEDDAWLEILMVGWNDEGKEVPRILKFMKPEFMEDEGIEVNAREDEYGDSDSDCEFLYGELYLEGGSPEFHMLFDNNGLKYLTFRCEEAVAEYGWNNERCRIGKVS